MMEDTELIEVVGALQAWHTKMTSQLRLIESNDASDIEIDGIQIKAGSDIALGMRIGIALSLELLGKLPIKLHYKADIDDGQPQDLTDVDDCCEDC